MTIQQAPRQVGLLARLAELEWEVRQVETPHSIAFLAVNDTRRLVAYDHALFWLAKDRAITAVSGGFKVDPLAPQMAWFAALGRHLADMQGSAAARRTIAVEAVSLPDRLARDRGRWQPQALLWVPVLGRGGVLEGGLFLFRATPFSDTETLLLLRLGNAYAHGLAALRASPDRSARRLKRGLAWAGALAALLLAARIPVPLTILAEARVVPALPFIVAAPLDGIVKELAVKPNEPVREGQVLVRLDDTELKAAEEVAARRVAVLTADARRTESLAFRDAASRAEIGVLTARLAEGEAELAYARARLARAVIRAERTGVAIADDPASWQGRPVKTGERLLVVAEPHRVRLELQIAIEDALVVTPAARVDFFLAVSPETPVAATLARVSYEARVMPSQIAAFVGEAELVDQAAPPRLGLTGTARIVGEAQPLGYVLLRKPLAWLRRGLGL